MTSSSDSNVCSGACPVAIVGTCAMTSAAHRVVTVDLVIRAIRPGPARVGFLSALPEFCRRLKDFMDQADLPQVATGQ